MLKWLAQHSPILMLLCCFAGFMFPHQAKILLPFLPYILFFLMFFTLLGINQKQLLRKLLVAKAWIFGAIHTAGLCVFFTGMGFIFGIRGELLLAISAATATAPLFATGALVRSVGYDAMQAMANTIAATLLMPAFLLFVLYFLAGEGAMIDLIGYTKKLIIYIVGPMLLSSVVRHYLDEHVLEKVYPRIAQITVVLVFAFPFSLMAGFSQQYRQHAGLAILLMIIAFIICFGGFALGYLLYYKHDEAESIPAAIASGNRNVLLTLTIAGGYLGTMYLPLIGAMQLPMYMQPLISRWMISRKYQKR